MGYIKIEDGVFAEEATPDPSRVYSVEGLQQELDMKQKFMTQIFTIQQSTRR